MSKEKDSLNPKQEEFCQLYVSPDTDFFGNGTQSYIEAYNPERKGNWYNSAMASASRLLRNVKICERINKILEKQGLNNQFVDKQLVFLITQFSNLKVKLSAIQEYNKLRGRIVDRSENKNKNEHILKLDKKTHKLVEEFISFRKKKI